jgi:tetratricopeptide (TPR) repeat protein
MANVIYLDRRDAAQALEYLERARVLAPDSLDWIATQLFILREEDRLDEAKQLIDEFADRKNDFDSHLLRATFYHSIGDSQEAAGAFARLPELSPDALGYATLGEYHAREGRLTDAIAVWELGLEAFPGDIVLRRGMAKALIMRASPGDRERAGQMLKQLREELPDNGELAWVQAELELSMDTEQVSKEAIDCLFEAIQLDPYRVEPYLRLIPLLLDRRENKALARAQELAARALEVHPRDERLILASAMVRLAAGDITGARERVQELLRAQPGNAQAVGMLAEIAMRSRDFDLLRSIRGQLAQAVEQQPENTWLHAKYAVALVVDGKREAALTLSPEALVTAADYLATPEDTALREHARRLYEHVINSAPQNAAAHFGLATLAYQRGDMEAALDGYRAALRLEPSNVDILNNLAWTLAEAHSADPSALDEALQHANEAVRLTPNDPNLRDTLGCILSKLPGRLEEARAAYQKRVELNQPGTRDRANALLQLGRTCARLDDMAEAHRCLQQALEIDRQRDVFTPEERAEIAELLERTDAK